MKRRLSQLFFVLSQPKLSVNLIILFSLMFFFNEIIVILYYMHCFWRNTPTYLPTYLPTNLIHSETCLMKNHKSTVDLFLTNKPKSFFITFKGVWVITINLFLHFLNPKCQDRSQKSPFIETIKSLMKRVFYIIFKIKTFQCLLIIQI